MSHCLKCKRNKAQIYGLSISTSVTPKFGIVAQNDQINHLTVRYFMPWRTHPTLAVTGSQCMASCALTPDTVAYPLMTRSDSIPAHLVLHHPMGTMDVITDYNLSDDMFVHKSAGIIRTARKLAGGEVFIPTSITKITPATVAVEITAESATSAVI